MRDDETELSSPFATGGGGPNFENDIQTVFVVLMLTGGSVPCLPQLPIKRIKLQGRYAGYETDDCIVFLESQTGGDGPRLLAQIKHKVAVTNSDPVFAEVIAAAWRDFNNPRVFRQDTDVLALITGPLSASDTNNVRVILERARSSETADEFLTKINMVKFSSNAQRTKLHAFRTHLHKANGGVALTDDQLWRFLKSFHIVGYDLDVAAGASFSFLTSHISQFAPGRASELLASVAKEVAIFNRNAGTITLETVSAELRAAFTEPRRPAWIPAQFVAATEATTNETAAALPPDSQNALAFASLLGGWNEKAEGDVAAIKDLIEGND